MKNGIATFFGRVKRGFRKLFYGDTIEQSNLRFEEDLYLQENIIINQENSAQADLNLINEKKSQTSKNTQESQLRSQNQSKRNDCRLDNNSLKSIPASSNEVSYRNERIEEPERNDDWNVFIKREKHNVQLSNTLFLKSSKLNSNVVVQNPASSNMLGHKRVNCVISEISNRSTKIPFYHDSPLISLEKSIVDPKPSSLSAKSNLDCSSYIMNSEEKFVKSINDSKLSQVSDRSIKSFADIKREIESKKIQNRREFDELKKKEELRNQREFENKKKVLEKYSALNSSIKASEDSKQFKFKENNLEIESSIVSINNQKESQSSIISSSIASNKEGRKLIANQVSNKEIAEQQKDQIVQLKNIKTQNPAESSLSNPSSSQAPILLKDKPKSITLKSKFNLPKGEKKLVDMLTLNPNRSTFFNFGKNKKDAEAELNYKWDIKAGIKFGINDEKAREAENVQHTPLSLPKVETFTTGKQKETSDQPFNESYVSIPQPPVNDELFIEPSSEGSGFSSLPKSSSPFLNSLAQPSIISSDANKVSDEGYMPKITLFGLKPSSSSIFSNSNGIASKPKSSNLVEESKNELMFPQSKPFIPINKGLQQSQNFGSTQALLPNKNENNLFKNLTDSTAAPLTTPLFSGTNMNICKKF